MLMSTYMVSPAAEVDLRETPRDIAAWDQEQEAAEQS